MNGIIKKKRFTIINRNQNVKPNVNLVFDSLIDLYQVDRSFQFKSLRINTSLTINPLIYDSISTVSDFSNNFQVTSR